MGNSIKPVLLFTHREEGPASFSLGRWVIDDRWSGAHGIGRFSREVTAQLQLDSARLSGNPVDAFDPIRLTAYLHKHKNRFIFSPGFNVPFFYLERFVPVIHDLNHLEFERSVLKRIYYNFLVKRACWACPIVLTVSQFSKDRIVEWSGVPQNKVLVVGNGVSEIFFNPLIEIEKKKKYFVAVSNRKSHKNEKMLLRAFGEAIIDTSIKLYITGYPNDEILEVVECLDLGGRVNFVGEVSDIELASLYRSSLGLINVSLYEGFGLPAAEAMASGTPVLASNSTALAEIVGSAGLLVDPNDVSDISRGIARLANDPEIASILKARGLQRVKMWRWPSVGLRIAGALGDVLGVRLKQ